MSTCTCPQINLVSGDVNAVGVGNRPLAARSKEIKNDWCYTSNLPHLFLWHAQIRDYVYLFCVRYVVLYICCGEKV